MPNTPKIVTRSETTSSNTVENLNKGSKLSFAEMDSNFLELRNGSIGIVGDDSTGIDLAHGSTLKVAGTGGISTTVSGDTLTVDASSIVTTSLGDLTAIGSTLIAPSNADITLDPSGTGNVVANADLVTPAITIHDNSISTNRSNDNIEISANGTGLVSIGAGTISANAPTSDAIILRDQIWANKSGTAILANGNITFSADAQFRNVSNVYGIYLNQIHGSGVGGDNTIQVKATTALDDSFKITDNTYDYFNVNTNTFTTDVQKVKFDDNKITTFRSNEDLEFDANGTGDVSSLAQLNMNSNRIINVTDPTANQDAATKAYVDAQVLASGDTGDLTINGSTITAPSNADLTLTVAGTGQIVVDGTLTATEVISDLTGTIEFDAKATEAITKGEAVYIAGIDGNTPTVALARANAAGTMPGFGIAADDISLNATGKITTFGSLTGLDVADFGETLITFALGDTVYISSAEAGKLTNVAPTGESNSIQNIGKIERVTPTTNMTIKVGGAGRSNATPALNEGNIFIGNSSNASSTVALSEQIKNYKAITVVGDDSTGTDVNIGETFKIAGGSNITTAVSGDTLVITGAAGSANTGDITFVGSTMSSPSNANFTIETAGTGKIILTGLTFPDTDGTADQILGTNGSGVLSFRDPTAINIDGGVADSVYTSVPTIDGGQA
jgi:hypothetical protein